jgi:hypothetical protein
MFDQKNRELKEMSKFSDELNFSEVSLAFFPIITNKSIQESNL